jgi:hypothetical protein
MKTITLYRPVGLKEMELITASNFKTFPPRLEWQPIFYPVMNQEYAAQIAREWNTPDEFSSYCGIVTAFEVDSEYLQQFEIQNVGDKNHNELWIPSEELRTFNENIVGEIKIKQVFYGEKYQPSQNETLNEKLKEIDTL